MIDAFQLLKLGPPLRLSAAQMDNESEITAVDVIQATLVWELYAPVGWKSLLAATIPGLRRTRA